MERGYICPYNGAKSLCTERCGDGINIRGMHKCDDGNTKSGDGCSATCEVEEGYRCVGYGIGTCEEICDGKLKGWLECDEKTQCCIAC